MAYGDNGIETGWLIEDRGNDRKGPPLFWTAHPERAWSFSTDGAIRFARREDAEAVIVGYLGMSVKPYKGIEPRVIATSHEWGQYGQANR